MLMVVLSVFAILRFEDLFHRGMLRRTVQPGYEMYLFWLEVSLSLIVPLAFLLQKKVRNSAGGLYLAAVMVVLGFITNRLNVSITGLESTAGMHYVPKWTEIAVTGAIIAAGFAFFGLAVKYLPIFPEEHAAIAHHRPNRSLARSRCNMPATDQTRKAAGIWLRLRHGLGTKLISLLTVALIVIFAVLAWLTVHLHRRHLEAAALSVLNA